MTAKEPGLGIFKPVFETAHGYLALLNLNADDAPQAVALVRDCCRKVANPYRDICCLLEEPNWRPHLVAAVAVIVSGYDAEAVKRLWHQVDTGSWVTPQIGVALFLVDRDFGDQSRSRLESGCPVDVSELTSMPGPERHSAAGPASRMDRSAKAAATLLYLLKTVVPAPSWVESLSGSERMLSLLANDIDRSEVIAERWWHRMQEITRDVN